LKLTDEQNYHCRRILELVPRYRRNLAGDVENASVLEELDKKVYELDPKLSWEIGPGSSALWQLVISPNLNRDLRQKAQEIVSQAPELEAWEFYPARRPKDWDYKVVIERSQGGQPIQLDASSWNLVFLQYPDGTNEVLLQGSNLPPLEDDERWQAAAITLESILGEEVLMQRIDEFELVDKFEPAFAGKQSPIRHLRDFLSGKSGGPRYRP
jgi:hypothetical protein